MVNTSSAFVIKVKNTTCGYCAEEDHIERNCPKKANMKVLAKNSKLQRRQAPLTEDQQQEPPTKEEVAKSFERNQSQEKKKEKEASKRPFSDSSNSPLNQSQKRKHTTTEETRSQFDLDPEFSTDSSMEFEEIRSYANPCCYELIQKCTGHYFACASEKHYFKCKCGWKTIGQEKGVYNCEQCKDIVANCVGCGSFQVKKKGKLFNCENCQCQLTKELHKSLTF